MYTTEVLISDFENLNLYMNSLKTMEESLFFEPLAEGIWLGNTKYCKLLIEVQYLN